MSDETPQEPVTPETPASPETPAEPVTEAPPVADAAATVPTEETPAAAPPVADAPPTAAAAAYDATPPVAAPVAPTATAVKERKSVAVPMSVLITLGAILVAALMFGIGYAVGHSDNDDNGAAVSTPIGNGNFPQLPNGNNGNGNTQTPNFPQLPGGNQQTPNQNGNGNNGNSGNGNQQTSAPPFMGVATQQAQNGLEVVEIVPNSAADNAGLQTGDVITQFDGNAVTTPAQLGNAVAQHDVGDKVQVTFTRNGQTRTVTVTLGTRTTSN